jgi:putative chitinase
MANTMDFEFTQDQLALLIPGNPYVDHWYEVICRVLPDYEITSKVRLAAFIAQCAHESNNFTAVKENLNYRWESLRKVFPKYFPTDAIAKQYAQKPEAIANRVYANRMGNGPESSGDGFRYCGRGLIQITGKNNYQAFADSIETPMEEIVDFLGTFEGCVQSACWFWEANGLNTLADNRNIITISRRINGGDIGMDDRIAKYNNAIRVLGA